jgi:hypothetical protein
MFLRRIIGATRLLPALKRAGRSHEASSHRTTGVETLCIHAPVQLRDGKNGGSGGPPPHQRFVVEARRSTFRQKMPFECRLQGIRRSLQVFDPAAVKAAEARTV